jgi:excisionase family DNA binding protein
MPKTTPKPDAASKIPRQRPDGSPRVLFSKDEVATITNTSIHHVERAIKSGALRKTKLGRLVRVHVDDLEAYIAAGRS